MPSLAPHGCRARPHARARTDRAAFGGGPKQEPGRWELSARTDNRDGRQLSEEEEPMAWPDSFGENAVGPVDDLRSHRVELLHAVLGFSSGLLGARLSIHACI